VVTLPRSWACHCRLFLPYCLHRAVFDGTEYPPEGEKQRRGRSFVVSDEA
jgi:hypothetical protein